MQEKLILESSRRIARRLSAIFDFTWPTAAAIWNLRWQVAGLLSVYPEITNEELAGRFTSGSGINRANLRSLTKTSWEDQQQEFSRFLLFEICALYESWCEASLHEMSLYTKDRAKQLQFASSIAANGSQMGVRQVINLLNASPSPSLTGSIYPSLVSNKKNSFARLERLLVCYRYFKEARNYLIHGSSGNVPLIAAQAAYSAETAVTLGVKEKPQFVPLVGDDLKLSLRGVAGFGDIVLRLVCSLDVDFSKSMYTEQAFIRRWRSVHGNGPLNVPHNPAARVERIRRSVKKLGLPNPVTTPVFENWLLASNLIF